MSDLLLLQERVRNTIQLGESHFREFKSGYEGPPGSKKKRQTRLICGDIGEALVAFANADGGELLIGVEDDGTITGVPHSTDEVAQMLEAPRTHVHSGSRLPLTVATKLSLDGQVVLCFSVMKGTTEIYQLPDGRCMRRKDKSTIPETPRNIEFDRQEVRSREFDRQFVDGASVTDLDLPYLETLANDYLRGLSVERYLQQIGVADYGVSGLRLRMAALLLFAKDIQRWHPRSQVRILKIAGTELQSGEAYNVVVDDVVQGNVSDLLIKSWEKLRPFLAYKTEFGADAKFEQKYIYPEWACREALVNAIAHRDYSSHNGIEVFIYDDRMEIRSPGALLSTLSIRDLEALQGAHESRNALIAKVLRDNKFMRELGEGIRRMFEIMEEYELEAPRLHTDSNTFSVTLPHKSVFTTRQEQWLSLFDGHDLSPRQKKIIAASIDQREISPLDIVRAMNTDDRDTYDSEVTALRNARILVEIRTNQQATNYAKRKKVPKAEVPRFRVAVPEPRAARELQRGTISAPSIHGTLDLRLFVHNLPYTVTRKDIEELFSRCGNVVRVDLPIDSETGRARGIAFVQMQSPQEVLEAIETLHGVVVSGRSIGVKQARQGPNK